MTLATLTNRLVAEGSIARVRVNRYQILGSHRVIALGIVPGQVVTLQRVHELFCVEVAIGSGDYMFRRPRPAAVEQERRPAPEPERLLTIDRHSYHSNGDGINRRGLERYLLTIPRDNDGVRRSYGFEWEIYSLTERQEDALVRLLRTLPHHVTERDGSLSSRGVEIVFYPMSKDKLIETWTALQNFCSENNVEMNNTGAHLTYGVSNATCSRDDLQIRLNRIALAVKSVSTQQAIKAVFGRDFTGYAALPTSTTYTSHSNAWSASRGTSAYELRLCNWKGDINKIVEFVNKTEFVFTRTFTAQDFINIFTVMGSNCNGI